jgi:predicted AlkP superfamily pyrophosphatase or phosphodiesterase
MKRLPRACGALMALLLATIAIGCRQTTTPSQQVSLVVVLTVDGLGADAFSRYAPHYTGGLSRLLREGRSFPAVVDHAITISHPGHVTIATGRHPSGHGIVDAAFAVPAGGGRALVDAVADPGAPILGSPELEGASPRWIEAPTLAEWIEEARPQARMVALGGGRFSSLLHAGHAVGDVYWFDRDVARFVTSAAYAATPASWVEEFNADVVPSYVEAAKRWEISVPPEARALLGEDARPFEADGEHTTFPHLFAEEMASNPGQEAKAAARWLTWGPVLDAAVLDLARRGIEARRLGQRNELDILDLVLSQVDSITHYYGPDSQELADALFRLDRELGAFFEQLDATAGKGRWTCVLTADHGMPQATEQRLADGLPGRHLQAAEIEEALAPLRTPGATTADLVQSLEAEEFIAAVYTGEQLWAGGGGDPFLELYRHSWRPDRIPRIPLFSLVAWDAPIAEAGLMVRLTEGSVMAIDITNHGSPYDYDRRVPLFFMGPGIMPGDASLTARTVDVAPTLAALLGIPTPLALDGRRLPLH